MDADDMPEPEQTKADALTYQVPTWGLFLDTDPPTPDVLSTGREVASYSLSAKPTKSDDPPPPEVK